MWTKKDTIVWTITINLAMWALIVGGIIIGKFFF